MDRTDPLDDDKPLTHRGPGHAPALWLALPLLIGCLVSATFAPGKSDTLALGVAALGGAMLTCRRSSTTWMICIAAGGAALGSTWHAVRAARMTNWEGERGQSDLFVEVARVEPRPGGAWRMSGWVQTGPPDTARRRVLCEGAGEAPAPGGLQVVSGFLAPVADRADSRDAWYRSQGISLRLGRARVAATIEKPGSWARAIAGSGPDLESGLAELPWEDPRGASLLTATMLGRTRLLEAPDREVFAATGTLHLFAISGLHIAGMAVAMAWLGRRCRIDARAAGVVVLAVLWLYVEATGGAPSARRAWIMAACILACTVARRKPNAVQGLALACAITLILDPEAATDAGFQLSYASVAGILLAGAPAARAVSRPGLAEQLTPRGARSRARLLAGWLRARALEGLCISLAAGMAGAAIALGTFGTLCPGGILANLVLVPLSGPPVVLGMVSITLMPLGPCDPLRHLLNGLAAAWLHGMAELATLLARIPGMTFAAQWQGGGHEAATATAVLGVMLLQPREPAGWRLLLRPLAALLAGLALGMTSA